MAYYLTIDIGNSSAKAALWLDDQMVGSSIQGQLQAADIEHLCAQAQGRVRCAAACSVTTDYSGLIETAKRLSDKCLYVTSETSVPISLTRYLTQGTLGADRIAALCGARQLFPGQEALVIDCGTAATYDRLSADGEFLGGNIAPGIGMRLRALSTFTARLPEVETKMPQHLWGETTVEAMRAGAFCGVAAEADYYYAHSPRGVKVVLTGGRSSDILLLVSFSAIYDPDLVLRGLKNIIDYNESK